MSFRFLSLIALFTGGLLFFLIGSFNLEWQPQGNGSTKMLVSIEFKLPKPAIENVKTTLATPPSHWGGILIETLRHSMIQALEKPDNKLKKLPKEAKHKSTSRYQQKFSPQINPFLKMKEKLLTHPIKRLNRDKNVKTASGGVVG